MKTSASPVSETCILDAPVGPLLLETTSKGVRRLEFMNNSVDLRLGRAPSASDAAASADLAGEVERQLGEYFDGTRREFNLPLDLAGTDFQQSVWQAIHSLPFGETASYGAIAAAIGRPTSYRAVGNACGRNPVVIVVPCHRVVGTDRGLHGFGGGLDIKSWLLRHEGSLDRVRDAGLLRQPALV